MSTPSIIATYTIEKLLTTHLLKNKTVHLVCYAKKKSGRGMGKKKKMSRKLTARKPTPMSRRSQRKHAHAISFNESVDERLITDNCFKFDRGRSRVYV